MNSPIASVEVFTLTQPRKVPYLGALREGEVVNPNGYIVRKGNRTVYPTFDRSVLVRMTTEAGVVGWGETYGIVAPGAVAALINDLLAGFVIGRDASDPSAIYDDLYDMMRVRGYTGGFYVDALAALDIALWDIAGQEAGKSVRDLLGGGVDTFPAYVSGLPEKDAQGPRGIGEILAGPRFQRLQVRNAGGRRWPGGRNGESPEGAWTRCEDRRRHALEPNAGTGAGTDCRNAALRSVVRRGSGLDGGHCRSGEGFEEYRSADCSW